MSALTKILTGAAGLAAVVGFSSPAAAQYYPNYGGASGGVVGAIINSVVGGGQYGGYGNNGYGANTQQAVQQCAAAVERRINSGYGQQPYGGGYGQPYGGGYSQPYGGYNQPYGGYNQPYGGGYAQPYGGGRVVSITHADRHIGGKTKIKGLATSGANAGYGGGYGGAQADLYFKCEVDTRGYISKLEVSRNNNGYGYNNGYRGY